MGEGDGKRGALKPTHLGSLLPVSSWVLAIILCGHFRSSSFVGSHAVGKVWWQWAIGGGAVIWWWDGVAGCLWAVTLVHGHLWAFLFVRGWSGCWWWDGVVGSCVGLVASHCHVVIILVGVHCEWLAIQVGIGGCWNWW